MAGAYESLSGWRPNLDFFVGLAPGTTVIPVIVSGVISRAALASPVTKLRRRPGDRRWLAASLQMLFPSLRDVLTEVRFGRPVRFDGDASSVSESVLDEARRMIRLASPMDR
jgi:hypothetical protein